MKAIYPRCFVVVGETTYAVDLRIIPAKRAPHVGADSPDYLRPGTPHRVRILRILRDGVDITSELTYWTRKAIEEKAYEMVKARACVGSAALSFNAEELR